MKAIDENDGLRARLNQTQPAAMKRLRTFRKNLGDKCNYVAATLKVLFANELYDDKQAFIFALQQAGYN